MTTRRGIMALTGLLLTSAAPAAAQQQVARADSAGEEIRTTLRAFYYHLAHDDWEALSAHILGPKIMANSLAPEAMVAATDSLARPERPVDSAPAAGDRPPCAADAAPLIDQATVTLDGVWAQASVPTCGGSGAGADDFFRFIQFEGRWRIVYIALSR